LVSSALAYLVAALAFTRDTWSGTVLRFDGARLLSLAKAGLPLTLSLTLLAMSSVIDRFIIAHLLGPAYAGQYTAGVDLVRQALIIPAVSAAAAYFPLAVQILAIADKRPSSRISMKASSSCSRSCFPPRWASGSYHLISQT